MPLDSSQARRQASGIFTASLVAFIALVLWNSLHKSMWTDESYSLNTAMRPLAGTIHQALKFELQPPLYFIALNGWLRLHAGIIFARLLSLACALGTLGVLAAIGRLVGMRGWFTPALLAVATPGVLWAADEARVYGLTLLLASSTLYWYLRLIVGDERPTRAAVFYAIFAYLSILTFYYSGFLLLGQWIGAVAVRRQVGRITAALAAVGAGLVPLVPTILAQRATHPIDLPLADPGHPLYTIVGTPLKALFTDTHALYLPHALPIVWGILVLVPILRFMGGEKAGADEIALIPAVAVPLAAIIALMYLHLVPVRHRHLVLLLPATLTLMSIWIARTRPGVPRVVSGAAVASLLLGFVVSFEVDPQYPEDWRQVADYLEQHVMSGERIVVFDPDRVLPLQYYLGPRARASGLPVDPDLDHYAPSEYAIRDTAAVARRLGALGAARGVWLVEAGRLIPALQPSVSVIDTFVHRHYVVGTPVPFRGVHVTHLQSEYAR